MSFIHWILLHLQHCKTCKKQKLFFHCTVSVPVVWDQTPYLKEAPISYFNLFHFVLSTTWDAFTKVRNNNTIISFTWINYRCDCVVFSLDTTHMDWVMNCCDCERAEMRFIELRRQQDLKFCSIRVLFDPSCVDVHTYSHAAFLKSPASQCCVR